MKAVPLPKVITKKIQQAPAHMLADGFHAKANSSPARERRRRERPKRPIRTPSRNGHHKTN
jgi:hypothetical protein